MSSRAIVIVSHYSSSDARQRPCGCGCGCCVSLRPPSRRPSIRPCVRPSVASASYVLERKEREGVFCLRLCRGVRRSLTRLVCLYCCLFVLFCCLYFFLLFIFFIFCIVFLLLFYFFFLSSLLLLLFSLSLPRCIIYCNHRPTLGTTRINEY